MTPPEDAAAVVVQEVPADDPALLEALECYRGELAARFPGGFAPGAPDPRDDAATHLLARLAGATVACGSLRPLGGGTVEVKRMWVDPARRGLGLGMRMLRELESTAAGLGHTRVVLDTNASLAEAVALYDRAGYARVERYNDNPHAELFFAKPLA